MALMVSSTTEQNKRKSNKNINRLILSYTAWAKPRLGPLPAFFIRLPQAEFFQPLSVSSANIIRLSSCLSFLSSFCFYFYLFLFLFSSINSHLFVIPPLSPLILRGRI